MDTLQCERRREADSLLTAIGAGQVSVAAITELYDSMPADARAFLPPQVLGAQPDKATNGYGFGSAV